LKQLITKHLIKGGLVNSPADFLGIDFTICLDV